MNNWMISWIVIQCVLVILGLVLSRDVTYKVTLALAFAFNMGMLYMGNAFS